MFWGVNILRLKRIPPGSLQPVCTMFETTKRAKKGTRSTPMPLRSTTRSSIQKNKLYKPKPAIDQSKPGMGCFHGRSTQKKRNDSDSLGLRFSSLRGLGLAGNSLGSSGAAQLLCSALDDLNRELEWGGFLEAGA